MSITVSTADEINRCPNNTSPTKQLYTFPKSSRFIIPSKKLNQKVAYDLPSTKSARSAGFGYGKRYDFANKNGSPPPTSYNQASLFKKNPNNKAYSFGIAREAYSKVYLKGHKGPDMARDIPGPGTYNNNLYDAMGKSGMSYSLRPRTGNVGIIASSKGIPGPGSYEFKSAVSPKGQQFLSKYRSSGAPSFNPPSSKRFRDNTDKNSPGPAEYNPRISIANTNGQYLSKIPTPNGRTFYHFDRNTLKLPTSARMTPGPGSYRMPSDFGHYESKNAKKMLKMQRRRLSTGTGKRQTL
jgi:hypothetical protein